MTVTLRPWHLPEDFARIAAIGNTATWEPTSPEALAAGDSAFPAQGFRYRLAAEAPSGELVGYGSLIRTGSEPEGRYTIRVVVDPDWRRQGVGSALLGALEAHACANGATCFETRFRDDCPEWLAFAEHHGYAVDGHHYGSQLDLQAFDEAPFTPVISRLESEGIHFLTMADPHTPALEQSVYDLCKAASADEPGFEDEPFPPFAAWREETLSGPAGLIVVAADGEKAVAFSQISPSANGNMRTHFTCVHRDYRGRNLALAVKLLVIRAGRRHGGKWLKTGSDSRNAAMLALNKKLGYVYLPGMYRCFKRL